MRRLSVIFLLLMMPSVCQNHSDILIDKTEYNYVDYTGHEFKVIEYEIQNQSDEPFLTFIIYDFYKDLERSILRYFVNRTGDFSLLSLLTDNVIFSDECPAIIGKTFLKQIDPNTSFKYIVIGDAAENIDFEKYIIVEKKATVESLIKVHISGKLLYEQQCIVLTSQTANMTDMQD